MARVVKAERRPHAEELKTVVLQVISIPVAEQINNVRDDDRADKILEKEEVLIPVLCIRLFTVSFLERSDQLEIKLKTRGKQVLKVEGTYVARDNIIFPDTVVTGMTGLQCKNN